MASKYTRNELQSFITIKEIEVVECPDCAFEYSAEHSNDDDKTIYECPLCELEEKDSAIEFAIEYLKSSEIKQVQMIVARLSEVMAE